MIVSLPTLKDGIPTRSPRVCVNKTCLIAIVHFRPPLIATDEGSDRGMTNLGHAVCVKGTMRCLKYLTEKPFAGLDDDRGW